MKKKKKNDNNNNNLKINRRYLAVPFNVELLQSLNVQENTLLRIQTLEDDELKSLRKVV